MENWQTIVLGGVNSQLTFHTSTQLLLGKSRPALIQKLRILWLTQCQSQALFYKSEVLFTSSTSMAELLVMIRVISLGFAASAWKSICSYLESRRDPNVEGIKDRLQITQSWS